ncbi:MAG: hypothetical protein M0R77_00830 [Gammaproteobacteria bacterium]|nr:hypothetical protein [Acholeplasmataceae bacterium]MCK9529099.1 hypothetical protein [Gammaproteobacteria bacterium]
MKLKILPGLKVLEKQTALKRLPEYVYVDLEREFIELLVELQVLINTNPLSITRFPPIETNSIIDTEELFKVYTKEEEISINITELALELVEVIDPFFDDYPDMNNQYVNLLTCHLYSIYKRLKNLDLFINGKLVYEFYKEYERGFLIKIKE